MKPNCVMAQQKAFKTFVKKHSAASVFLSVSLEVKIYTSMRYPRFVSSFLDS